MKPWLTNQFVQWTLMILICSGIAYAAYPMMQLEKSRLFASTNKPALTENLQLEAPKTPVSTAPAPLSRRIVEYHIAVALQPEEKTLQGMQTVTWKNPGTKPISELYFHLYPNAFESKKTTFQKESGGKLRQDVMKDTSYGGMQIQSLKTSAGYGLENRISFIQPDDGNAHDHTLIKVTLPDPVPPNKDITLNMQFTVKLPYVFARMGYADDDFYMIGQWFPKLAVYEPAGTRGRTEEGWNLHQYHGNSEFYSDFGIYNVNISVPSAYKVAATGFPVGTAEEQKGIKTYHFYADDVHDFAWAASPHFVYYEEPFSTPNIPGVKIKLYLDPEHKDLKERYMQAAKKALTRYSEWYGRYPYSTLSIVVPPEDANGAGGMEYPTLVTAWGASSKQPGLELERVVVHEIGHQYWYGIVATNEFEEAWLDEGFTSYAEDKVMERDYGRKSLYPLEASYVTSPEPLKQNSWDYGHHEAYADNVYIRAKLVLNEIERRIGSDEMKRVLRAYFQRYKFKHPDTHDFQTVLEETTKKSWADFFNQFVYKGLMLDYTVDNIHVRKTSRDGNPLYISEVLIRKRGGQVDSVPIQFHFSDGAHINKIWDSKDNEVMYKLDHTAPVDWVNIDPDHTLLLENRHINNFMKTTVDPQTNVRWNTSIVKILETLFGWVAW